MLFLFCVLLVIMVFTYTNGFHDAANSIATVVATRVLSPKQAIIMAAILDLVGALAGTAVAVTVGKGMVHADFVNMTTVFCGMIGAISWNLLTWYYGIPSSSSHALMGGLIGAAVASAHGDWNVIIWSVPGGVHWWQKGGVLYKIIIPMVFSPLCGFCIGNVIMRMLYFSLSRWRPTTVAHTFGKLQLASSAYMAFSHGTNDAQKTMG